jgi:multisubunit Na+/H+ antiporter MnhB subunit
MNTLILTATIRALLPLVWGLSVYLLLRGHDAPGGGFIAALVAGAAVVLRDLAVGTEGGPRFRFGSTAGLLGTGILLVVGYGLAGLVMGSSFLEGAVWRGGVPVLGDVKLATSLMFDLGVYLVVVGAVVGIVRRLGEEGR